MTQPVVFVAHGAPTLALDASRGADFAAWGRTLTRPRALLVVSAHWERTPVACGCTSTVPLIYDFHGFPPPLYQVRYPAPGAPWLAERVAGLLGDAGFECGQEPQRGLDHGVWVPLLHLFPEADVPVLQLALPGRLSPAALHAVGRSLAPLRDEGVLLMGSGVLVHNLRSVDFSERSAPPAWAVDFDDWCADVLRRADHEALLDFRRKAPGFERAHPTDEHFLPLLFAAGAAGDDAGRVSFPVTGFEFGSLSRRSVQFGEAGE